MKMAAKLIAALLVIQTGIVSAGAIDNSKSTVTATFKQLGVPVDAKFKTFSGQIDFDPANPATGKAQLTLTTASFDLGDPEYNKEVQKKEWLNSTQFPQATFVSSSIKSAGGDKLQVQGKLTLKGKTLDVNVPVTFKQDGKVQTFEGTLPIKRLYFNIGEGDWKDTDTLADEVIIKFKAVTSN
ncbi:MAG TPA: YceI family protein [Spongiibacteraceae bacterium]|jgi:polyisoprenoid-binding protein YceI